MAGTGESQPPMPPASPAQPPMPPPADFDLGVARLLTAGTYISIAFIGVGLVAMILAGISPLAPAPTFELGRIPADLLAGRPEGFLWLGIIAVIATPTARLIAALAGYLRTAEWPMAAVAAGALGVIALSVILARLTET